MSGYGYRNAVLQLDAALWRKRVIVEAESAEGRAAADAHQVPIELIGVVAARIAGLHRPRRGRGEPTRHDRRAVRPRAGSAGGKVS